MYDNLWSPLGDQPSADPNNLTANEMVILNGRLEWHKTVKSEVVIEQRIIKPDNNVHMVELLSRSSLPVPHGGERYRWRYSVWRLSGPDVDYTDMEIKVVPPLPPNCGCNAPNNQPNA